MENNNPDRTQITARIIRYTIPVLVVFLLAYITWQIPRLISMILIAYLLSYVFRPFVQRLERRGIPRTLATLILFTGVSIVMLILLWGAIPRLWEQLVELRSRLIQKNLGNLVESYLRMIESNLNFLPGGTLVQQVDVAYAWIIDQLGQILRNVYVFLEYLFFVPIILFFMIRDGDRFKRGMFSLVPNSFFEMFYNLLCKIDVKLGAYIRGVLFESLIIAMLNIIGFWVVDVPYAVIIGLFAGFCNMVPYLGPMVGGIPALIIKYLEQPIFVELIPVLVVLAAVQLIDNVWAKPYVMSKSMNIHPLVVILAVVTGGKLYGVLGMILSIPVASIFLLVFSELHWAIRNYRFQS